MLHNIKGVIVLAFADDIAIICDTIFNLRESINTITKWCKENKM